MNWLTKFGTLISQSVNALIFGADHCYQAALSDKDFAEAALRRWQ